MRGSEPHENAPLHRYRDLTAWAKPKDLLIAYKFANASEWRRHLIWLEDKGYPFLAQLRKEIAHGDKAVSRSKAANKAQPTAFPSASGDAELSPEIQEMGDDLLA